MAVSYLRKLPRLQPILLAKIWLKNNGPILYHSDRDITILGQIWENYIEEITGITEEVKRNNSTFENYDITVKFKNDKWAGYNFLIEAGAEYPFHGASIWIYEVMLDDEGRPDTPLLIIKGKLDQPKSINLSNFSCKVSSNLYWYSKRFAQDSITKALFPNADPDDINKYQNIVYGTVEQVKCHAIRAGGCDPIASAWTATSPAAGGIADISNSSEFPVGATFIIQIDDEQILINSRASSTSDCIINSRHYNGTTADAHDKGSSAYEVLSEYVYLAAGHPVHQLNNCRVDKTKNTNVTFYTGQSGNSHPSYPNKAVLSFSVKAKVEKQVNLDAEVTSEGSHAHTAASSAKAYGTGGTENAGTGGQVIGTNLNCRDGNEGTYCRIINNNGSVTGEIRIDFPAWTGGAISACYVWVTHNSVANGTYGGLSIGGVSLGTSTNGLCKQRVYLGAGYPANNRVFYYASSGISGNFDATVYEIELEVVASGTGSSGATGVTTALTGRSSADVVIGSEITVDIQGYQDDASGTYTGTPQALIERPDHVIKHILMAQLGFVAGDLNTAAFAAAGSSYASAISGGYKFGFAITEKWDISDSLEQMALECRSTFLIKAGVFYLNYLPSTAPAAVATISRAELAEEFSEFEFDCTLISDLVNYIKANFYYDMGDPTDELYSYKNTQLTSIAYDQTSIDKYGKYSIEITFAYIRLQAMADHVVAHMLLQRKNPLLENVFEIFWDKFPLDIGDTFDISNDLFNGKKFFVQSFERVDKFKGKVKGLEWW